ncbi:hypothetical protein [Pseudooctadecabacter jejudonensis]|uniref:Tetratricopeptide repeat protein n=1 Tax=Pseudooctadecabacter jejudonensis TaxID=1391910 RepID=A0A1Y5RQI7_9RHOB|nr:hypothetical protein [Pseudooctadecabacter jejudonensis]SLN20308.1 hypothetical protein PSJ8397_00749 [Pseudooctadecabacter jejudonensis]
MIATDATRPEGCAKVNPASVQGLSEAEALANLTQYRMRPHRGFEALRHNTQLCANGQIAAALVECAIAVGRLDVVDIALPLADDRHGLLAAMAAMAAGNPARALDHLGPLPDPDAGLDRARYLGVWLRASLAAGTYHDAVKVVQIWARDAAGPRQPYRVMARALADMGDPRAERWFERAFAVSGQSNAARLDLAEYLISQGRTEAARYQLTAMKDVQGRTARRQERMLRRI